MEIPLTKGKVALIDECDLPLIAGYSWSTAVMGRYQKIWYAVTKVKNSSVYMHQMLCPGQEVDHRNNDGLDNRQANLRPTTHRLNMANQRKQVRPTSSRFKGVTLATYGHKQKPWVAQIGIDGRKYRLGYHTTEEEAARTYNAAALAAWGEFARLNEVD